MNQELSKVVVTLTDEKGVDALLETAEKFDATQIQYNVALKFNSNV